MNGTLTRSLLGLVAMAVLAGGCGRKEDWSDPEYIGYRMGIGDDRAFQEFTRLDDAGKKKLVPALIDTYNKGIKREQAVTALIATGDPAAKDVFLSALGRSDDGLAASAARGLGVIKATDTSGAIAERLKQVTTREAFAPMVDALVAMPSPPAAEALAQVLMRPAGSVGGVDTVRKGCAMFASLDSITPTIADAIVFSFVNFNPQPYEDTLDACEPAALRHKAETIPKVVELFELKNERAVNHIRSLKYQPVTAQLRAAQVMAHSRDPVALASFGAWLGRPQPVPRGELAGMSLQDQQDWYTNHGQLFGVVLSAYGYVGDVATLQKLDAPGEGKLLNNFADWFTLSDGAERGLRQSTYEYLAKSGDEASRAVLWAAAESGKTTRGGEVNAVGFRRDVLHFVGYGARPGELARYTKLVAAQPERFRKEFTGLKVYFLAAERCGEDASCLSGLIADPSPILADPELVAMIEAAPEQAKKPTEEMLRSQTITGAAWQLATRFGGSVGAAEELIKHLGTVGDVSLRYNLADALLYVKALPTDARAGLEAALERDAGKVGVPMLREYRALLRVVMATRL